jgi:hypothetical protein
MDRMVVFDRSMNEAETGVRSIGEWGDRFFCMDVKLSHRKSGQC